MLTSLLVYASHFRLQLTFDHRTIFFFFDSLIRPVWTLHCISWLSFPSHVKYMLGLLDFNKAMIRIWGCIWVNLNCIWFEIFDGIDGHPFLFHLEENYCATCYGFRFSCCSNHIGVSHFFLPNIQIAYNLGFKVVSKCSLILSWFEKSSLLQDVVRKGSGGWKKVVAEFGEDILWDDGEIDRAQLGQLVFSDPSKRQLLNRYK